MRYRPHRKLLADSMANVASFADLDALIFYMREVELKPYAFRFNDSQVRVTPYHGDDDRIGWKDVHIVTIDGLRRHGLYRWATDMSEPKHTYPSNYPPGVHWAVDEAWAILDHIKPGVIPDDVRAYLAGGIAGALSRIAIEGKPKIKRDGRP